MNEKHIQQAQTLDAEWVKAAGYIRVLQHLAWPFEAEEVLPSAWRAGRPQLPAVRLEPVDRGPAIDTLESIAARCDRGHHLSNLIYKTAKSYAAAAHMLAGIGTPEFARWSIELYGRPDEVYKTQSVTGLDAAQFLLDTTDRLCGGRVVPETESTIPAEQFAGMLRADIDAFFTDDKVAARSSVEPGHAPRTGP